LNIVIECIDVLDLRVIDEIATHFYNCLIVS